MSVQSDPNPTSDPVSQTSEPISKPSVRFVTIGEFLSTPSPTVKWVVDGLLPTGGTSLVTSKPRCGKSTLVRNLIVSAAQGRPFLRRPVAPVKTAYLCLEEIDQMVKESFIALGAQKEDPIFIHTGDLDPRTAAVEVHSFIKEHRPGLVVVDTLGKFLPILDFNDYGAVNLLMSRITAMLRQFPETHLMYVHHSKKESGEDDYLGSVAFHGNVDVYFRMFRSGDRHYISARQQRYGIDLPQTELTMNPTTSIIDCVNPLPDEEKVDPTTLGKCLDAIRGGCRTWRDVRDAVGGRYSKFTPVRRHLVDSGVVTTNESGELCLSS